MAHSGLLIPLLLSLLEDWKHNIISDMSVKVVFAIFYCLKSVVENIKVLAAKHHLSVCFIKQ